VGYDTQHRQLCETRHETAGVPAAIRLTLHTGPNGFVADGADLALIDVEVTDAKGLRCPTDTSLVHFDLQGPANWRGGMAQGPGNYILSKDLPVECGVNRVMLRSATVAGAILLKATAKGLRSAELTIASHPFDEVKGLSKQIPGAGLTASLDRGPTPAGPSYTLTRQPLKIVSATAGSNTNKAALSYDDNETTDWFSDGQLATAWIQYELERPAAISEIALKLNNFRTRSYPLRITVDGQEVFRGFTSRNLGYYTASFPARTGRTVKIELTAADGGKEASGTEVKGATGTEVKEATGTEVNGKKLDDGVARDDGGQAGRLSIIEAELYEKDIPKN
jgi:beta-galactosidase